MDLISHEEVAELAGVVTGDAVEEGGDFNNAGGLFVVGDLVGAGEECRIVLGDLGEFVGADVVGPDLGDTVVSAWIFLEDDVAVGSDGEVVEHHLAFTAIEQHFDGATGFRIGGIGELQGPEAAGGGSGGGGGEVEGLAIEAPGTVFRPQEVGDAGSFAVGVEGGAVLGFHIAEIDEAEAAGAVGEGEAGFGGLAEIADFLGGGGAGADLDAEEFAAGETGFLDSVSCGCLVADVDVNLAIDGAVIEGNGDGLGLFPGVGNDVLKGEIAKGGQLVNAAGFRAGDDVGEGAALSTGLLAGEVDASVVAGAAGLEGGGCRQITGAEAREGGGGAVGPGGAGGVGEVEVVGGLEEVATGNHGQSCFVDRQIRHIGALGAMGACGTGGVAQLMVHEHTQGGAVVDDTDAIGDAVEAEAVIGLFTGGDDLLEGGPVVGADEEIAGREGLLGDVGIRQRVEHTCPGVVGVASQIHQLLAQLQGGLDDLLAFGPVAIPGIEVVRDLAGFVEQGLLFEREGLAGGKLLQWSRILGQDFRIASIEQELRRDRHVHHQRA